MTCPIRFAWSRLNAPVAAQPFKTARLPRLCPRIWTFRQLEREIRPAMKPAMYEQWAPIVVLSAAYELKTRLPLDGQLKAVVMPGNFKSWPSCAALSTDSTKDVLNPWTYTSASFSSTSMAFKPSEALAQN